MFVSSNKPFDWPKRCLKENNCIWLTILKVMLYTVEKENDKIAHQIKGWEKKTKKESLSKFNVSFNRLVFFVFEFSFLLLFVPRKINDQIHNEVKVFFVFKSWMFRGSLGRKSIQMCCARWICWLVCVIYLLHIQIACVHFFGSHLQSGSM